MKRKLKPENDAHPSTSNSASVSYSKGGGRVVRSCWVNFQCWGVLLICIIVGQGPVVLAVGAGGGCLDIFSLICPFSPLSPSLWETARYRLKYCLKRPLNPKQPTNQPSYSKQKKKRETKPKAIQAADDTTNMSDNEANSDNYESDEDLNIIIARNESLDFSSESDDEDSSQDDDELKFNDASIHGVILRLEGYTAL